MTETGLSVRQSISSRPDQPLVFLTNTTKLFEPKRADWTSAVLLSCQKANKNPGRSKLSFP